jgi:hypothetical protein
MRQKFKSQNSKFKKEKIDNYKNWFSLLSFSAKG